MNWIKLNNADQLKEIDSAEGKHIIFKHSTTCGISKMVLRNFEREIDSMQVEDNSTFYFLDLLSYRSISNLIAEKYSVEHQSPQLIVLEKGLAIHDASHSDISGEMLAK